MRTILPAILILTLLLSCNDKKTIPSNQVEGTWKLISGTVIENGDTNITRYTEGISFIKIINRTHFAFIQHDLNKGQDSANVFVAGAGMYSLDGDSYTEHLEYCSARNWEGNDFTFTVSVKGDTLIQSGIEKIDAQGINRLNIEKYVKIAK